MRISDWSSDVCSSDLQIPRLAVTGDLVMDVTTRHVGEGEVDPNIGSRDRTGHPWRNEGISQGALKGQAWHNDDRWLGDRKSTRLTPVTNANLVCRLLLEKKKEKNKHRKK